MQHNGTEILSRSERECGGDCGGVCKECRDRQAQLAAAKPVSAGKPWRSWSRKHNWGNDGVTRKRGPATPTA